MKKTPNGESPAANGCVGCLFVYCLLLVLVIGGMLLGGPLILLVGVTLAGVVVLWLLALIARVLDWILQYFR